MDVFLNVWACCPLITDILVLQQKREIIRQYNQIPILMKMHLNGIYNPNSKQIKTEHNDGILNRIE